MQMQRACLATRRKNKLASECCRILPLVTGNERIMANIARQRERLPSTDLPRDGVLCIRDESGRQRQCHGGSNFRDERSRLDLQ